MKGLLLVALGGAVGSVARFKLSGLVLHHTTDWKFPAGTFAVNVIGCLVAGILAGMAEKYGYFSSEIRLLLFTGLLGGFTTFSSFGLQTFTLLREGEMGLALLNIAASNVGGILMVWCGYSLARVL